MNIEYHLLYMAFEEQFVLGFLSNYTMFLCVFCCCCWPFMFFWQNYMTFWPVLFFNKIMVFSSLVLFSGCMVVLVLYSQVRVVIRWFGFFLLKSYIHVYICAL